MVFEAALFAVLLGLILRGSLKKLADLKLKGLWLIFASLALALCARADVSFLPVSARMPAAFAVCALRYGALLLFVAVNISRAALWPAGLGGFLNLLVSAANGGRMPVKLGAAAAGKETLLLRSGRLLNYCLATPGTRLSFLADGISLRGFSSYLVSPGDLFLAVGIFLFLLFSMEPAAFSALRRRRMPRA